MDGAIRELRTFNLVELRELNNSHQMETSFLTGEALSRLIEIAFYARGFSGPAAFLLAFDESAPYDNANFQFFRGRCEGFVYIDRLITADFARRQGLARRLYEDLFAEAIALGHRVIGCEVNLDPPNPASDAFHAGLGFVEVGRALLANGKTVRYLQRSLE